MDKGPEANLTDISAEGIKASTTATAAQAKPPQQPWAAPKPSPPSPAPPGAAWGREALSPHLF